MENIHVQILAFVHPKFGHFGIVFDVKNETNPYIYQNISGLYNLNPYYGILSFS